MDAAANRYPKATGLGTAAGVTGSENPARPDRSYSKLWWLSLVGFLGLDHFYLRSPKSGLLKLATGGGFLIWWLWDLFQLTSEKSRVLKFGMTAPFDWMTGFGQGTIVDGDSHYEQRTDSAWWMFAAIFSFLGADAFLMKNWAAFLRKLTEGIIFCVLVWSLTTTWAENGMSGLATVDNIFKVLVAILFGLIVVSGWASVVFQTFVDPEGLFSNGIYISKKMDEILNFPRAWVKNIKLVDPKVQEQIMKDIGYASISGDEMKRLFEVRFMTAAQKAAERKGEAAADAEERAKEDANPVRWHWLLSYAIYLFGPLVILFQWAKDFVVWCAKGIYMFFGGAQLEAAKAGAKAGLEMTSALAAGKSLSEAAADAAVAATSGIPGMGEIAKHVAEAQETAAKVSGTVEAAKAAAAQVTGTMTDFAGATEGLKSVVSGHLAGAEQSLKGAMSDHLAEKAAHAFHRQGGGARHDHEEPTGQGMVLGATVFALAGGAAIKLAVDYLLPSQ
jgi:hypothetical protein